MSHENAKILYQSAQEAQQKFEYFITGAIGAMFAYMAQTYSPKRLEFTPSTLEPIAIISLAIAFYFGLRRVDCLYHHFGISSQETQAQGDAEVLKKALRMIAEDPIGCSPTSDSSIPRMEKELSQLRSRAESAKPILEKLDRRIAFYYRWRNRLMISGVCLIVAARVLSPYFDTTKPQTQQTDHAATEPQEVTTKVQSIPSPLTK